MKQPFRMLITAGLFTLLIAAAVRFDLSEWLRGGYGWRWTYDPLELISLLPLLVCVVIYLIGAWWLLSSVARPRYVILWSMFGTFAIVLAAVGSREGDVWYALFARAASELSTGPHWVAAHIDWSSGGWRDWGKTIGAFGGHLSNLPPGSILWYALLNNLFDQVPAVSLAGQRALMPLQCHNYALLDYTPGQWTSVLFGMAMPLWAAFTPIPLYAVAKRLVPENARAVVLWYALIPALSGFAGTWNTLYPLIAVLALLMLLQNRPFFSGLISGLGIFINFALVPLALFLGLWVLVNEWIVKRRSLAQCILTGMYYGIGLVLIWVAFWMVSGQTPFDLLRAGMSFHLTLDRPYWFWVVMHLWDFLLWGGLVFAVVIGGLLFYWLRNYPLNRAVLPVMSLTITLTMIILVLSGTARGETGRVWLFFAPFLLLAAGEYRRTESFTVKEWVGLAIPQAVLLLALVSSISSMSTNFTPVPSAPQVATTQPANALFMGKEGQFRLVGWDGAMNGDKLILRLNWQGIEPSLKPIWFGGVLVDANGATIPLEAWQPGGESRYPTTCWSNGTLVGDTLTVRLDNVSTGDYWLSLAAYDGDNPMIVQTDSGEDTQIGLGPITGR